MPLDLAASTHFADPGRRFIWARVEAKRLVTRDTLCCSHAEEAWLQIETYWLHISSRFACGWADAAETGQVASEGGNRHAEMDTAAFNGRGCVIHGWEAATGRTMAAARRPGATVLQAVERVTARV